MAKNNDWMQQINTQLHTEMQSLASGASAQFAFIRPKAAPPPTRSQRVNDFLNSPIQEQQQKAVQMGPQAWKEYMDTNLNDVAAELGNQKASQLAQFYEQSQMLPQTPDIMQPGLEAELMQLIGSNNGGGPQPAQSALGQ